MGDGNHQNVLVMRCETELSHPYAPLHTSDHTPDNTSAQADARKHHVYPKICYHSLYLITEFLLFSAKDPLQNREYTGDPLMYVPVCI